MELKQLLLFIKETLIIDNDNEIRAYIHENNNIEIIEHSVVKYTIKGVDTTEIYNTVCLNIKCDKDNNITSIDHSFTLFTKANKNAVIDIVGLIGTCITDLDRYDRVPSIDKMNYVTI